MLNTPIVVSCRLAVHLREVSVSVIPVSFVLPFKESGRPQLDLTSLTFSFVG